ncbi:class I SAM-dependent DNA methyltransferase [Cryptosporangium aurantiacum]|uniref:Methyltransferase domain-containing protein n=1 Tax=Cryptosporangium aurantiacum TaxID=134849 RepID=A0A1M7K8X2_9ACTN|nr:class I SAM-dependent methyltransferase [Cryptosporangium aurantiacum]SHM61742.1 Methyltransferase domain-containing protein [Cryptosporangium aurantiacum]
MSEDGYFGESVAATYDDPESTEFQPDVVTTTVDVLAELAGSGPAVEFAIGTGRIALPLTARGIPVHGIELSNAMAARLRAKPGGDAVPVTIGDMTSTRLDGSFSLAYLVFNTIMNLTTQAAQVACFRNAAAHLAPGGRFVVEVMVPGLRRLPPGQTMVPFLDEPGRWAFDRYDTATQALSSNYVEAGEVRSIPFRYVWPSELDLMAQLAGLRLLHRWDDWNRRPFTHESTKHVSVWEKPA